MDTQTVEAMDLRNVEAFVRAKQRFDHELGFYFHLVVFAAVNIGLVLVDWLTGGGWWFYWVLLGWGIGLVVHGFVTFVGEGRFARNWEDRKIRQYMKQDAGIVVH